jgi:hypothetical protein
MTSGSACVPQQQRSLPETFCNARKVAPLAGRVQRRLPELVPRVHVNLGPGLSGGGGGGG